MAWLTGSVDEIELVDTVEVVNCFTVLRGFNIDIIVDKDTSNCLEKVMKISHFNQTKLRLLSIL